jgi:hypothetical protein
MLLNGLLTWLTEQPSLVLTRLVINKILLMLLAGPPVEGVAAAFAVGLILSLVALWVTPRLGKPQLTERAWLWPYLPAIGATLTLAGLPFWLGWPVQSTIYRSLSSANIAVTIVVILAEGLALSGLVGYWLLMWQGANRVGRQAVAGAVIMVPFLIPGLAPFILSTMTRTELPAADFNQPVFVFIAFAVVVAGAIGLGYFKTQIMSRLNISPASLTELVYPRWIWWYSRGEKLLNIGGKSILRIVVFLEGQHYIGWAFFTALVGILIIFLRT